MSLEAVLSQVDWNNNVNRFCASKSRMQKLTMACQKVSLFTHEISFQNFDNPALPFLQEMKASTFQVPACISLGLAKPAAGLMRAAVKSVLYYSYFCTHGTELRTLLTKKEYYLSKRKVMDYHFVHTARFGRNDTVLHLSSKLDGWYSEVSAIVHGQIPGVWTSKSLRNTSALLEESKAPIKLFERATDIIQLVFLMTISPEDWEGISPISRSKLLQGLTKSQTEALGLPAV